MKISYPYFLHLIRYLFFFLCVFASICMFYSGFSPFRYILPNKTQDKSICIDGGSPDAHCIEGTYDKLILVVVDGWNSMNAEYLNHTTMADALPVIYERTAKNKLKGSDEGIAVYLDLLLDNTTSPSAITKTMLTGNLPGLIDIPKQMYFNNTVRLENG